MTLSRRALLLWVLAQVGVVVWGAEPDASAGPIFRWRPFLAPFHSVVLHFPIGFLTMAGILEAWLVFRPNEEIRRVAGLSLWLGLGTGLASACFGWMRAFEGGYEPRSLELHRWFGLTVPIMNAVLLGLHRGLVPGSDVRWRRAFYRAGLIAVLVLVTVAGHLGGNLTHGSKYLTENAPDFIRRLLEEQEAAVVAEARDAKARHYIERVRPLFDAKCVKCHGPEKQKGGYRMDDVESLFRGGKSDHVAVKPNDPVGSQLVKLILLPPHHDDVMPPEGKEPLTLEETMWVIDWIRNGAVTGAEEAMPASIGRQEN